MMVNLDIPVSLDDLKTKRKEKEIKGMEQALLAHLDPQTQKNVGFRSNSSGQVGLLLTPDGLARLAKAGSLVKAVHDDTTEGMRRGVSDDDGRLDAIKAEIVRYGTANIRLYRFDSDPQDLTIDLEQFYLLKEADDVRALHLVGWNPTGTVVDPEALATARETGYADVIVSLRPPLDYTAMIGKTPKAVWDAQAQEIRGLFEIVLPGLDLEEFSGFPVAHVPNLPLAILEDPPAGLASIALNRRNSLSLVQSEALIHMQNAWNHYPAYDGTGQNVVIIDSGVDKNHPFLGNRVVYEACFGTTDSYYVSICPQPQDALFDSPLGLSGSGMPKPNDSKFNHGTHVAGIAAGRNSTMSGVARNASIVAIQVFSANRTTGGEPGAANADIYQALNKVLLNAATDNYTVNLSLGGGLPTFGCWNLENLQSIIDGLSSKKIPVVAATGNNSYNGRGAGHDIVWPACLDKVIKASAVTDASSGAYESPGYANIDKKVELRGQLLLAPGGSDPTPLIPGSIYSSIPGGLYKNYSGTSMAAPHVTGLYAAYKQAVPGTTIQAATDWIVANAVQTRVVNTNTPAGQQLDEWFPRINLPVL